MMFCALAQKFLAKPRSTLAFEHASSCCFKTSTKSPAARGFHGTTWVVKRYLKETSKDILAIGQAMEEYTQKVVQMHCPAQNFAAKLKDELTASDREIFFGENMSYKKIYMGTIDRENETVEKLIDRTFRKYVNNNGNNICQGGNDDPLTKMADCLAHISYERSHKEVMLQEIQGSVRCLFDPKIASKQLEPNHFLFFTGNLFQNAIQNFTASHKCSDYCNLLRLTPFE